MKHKVKEKKTSHIESLESCISKYREENELPDSIKNDELFEHFTVHSITKSYCLSSDEIDNSIVDGNKDGPQ